MCVGVCVRLYLCLCNRDCCYGKYIIILAILWLCPRKKRRGNASAGKRKKDRKGYVANFCHFYESKSLMLIFAFVWRQSKFENFSHSPNVLLFAWIFSSMMTMRSWFYLHLLGKPFLFRSIQMIVYFLGDASFCVFSFTFFALGMEMQINCSYEKWSNNWGVALRIWIMQTNE